MYRLVALLVIAGACRTVQNPPMPKAQPPEPDVTEKTPAAPVEDLHAKAKQQVAQLKAKADQNVLLAPFTGPYGGVPPWDKIKSNLFPEAFALGIELRAAEVDVIANDPTPPTFANTFVALEDAGRHLGRAETLFSVMSSSLNTSDVQDVDKEWSPKLAMASDAITFNTKLFARMTAVYDARDKANLTPEQLRLVTEVYDQFVRSGAKLTPSQKKEMGKINEELALAFTEFQAKVLADEETWMYLLGLLNSKVVAYYLRSVCPPKLSGYIRFSATYINQVPLPDLRQLPSGLRRDLLSLVEQAQRESKDLTQTRKRKAIQDEIDAVCMDLYGLTAAERSDVKSAISDEL